MPLPTRKLQLFSFLVSCMMLFNSARAQFFQAGELDTTFNFGLPHSFFVNNDLAAGQGTQGGRVYSSVVLSDGKILIAGMFAFYNGVMRRNIARVNADGSLDTTFNPGTGTNDEIITIAVQLDGKVLIGGRFTQFAGISRNGIARLNLDGSLDTTFNPGLGVSTGGLVKSITIQPDGKIILAGDFFMFNGIVRRTLARLNANGSLDLSLNPGLGVDGGSIFSVALQTDGKIIIVGYFNEYNGLPQPKIARLFPNGGIDTSFRIGTGPNSLVYCLLFQANGKLLIGGGFTEYNGIPVNRVARLNQNGSLDTTFNPGIGPSSYVFTLAMQRDGRLLVGGEFEFFNTIRCDRIVRLHSNGGLDTTFKSAVPISSTVHSISALNNDKMLVCGWDITFGLAIQVGIISLNSDGRIDQFFNPITGLNPDVYAVGLQADGKVIIGGNFSACNGLNRGGIARLLANGITDTTFDLGGMGIDVGFIETLKIQQDGKVLIGGSFLEFNGFPRKRLARLNANGSLDTSFNTAIGANNSINSIDVQTDGKVLIGGLFTSYDGIARNRIARLNSDGSLDLTFNPGTGSNGQVLSVSVQNTGKILIGGSFTSYNGIGRGRIARINSDGSLDISFDTGSGASSAVYSVTTQIDGKVVLAGDFSFVKGVQRSKIARLNHDGSLDTSFLTLNGANDRILALTIQPNGMIIAAGRLTTYNNTSRNRIVRINTDGSLDNSFDPVFGASDIIRSIAYHPEGKLVIAGNFERYNNIHRKRIARIFAPSCSSAVTNSTSPTSICGGDTKMLLGTPGGSWEMAYGPGQITGTTYTANGGSGTVSLYNRVGSCYSPLVTFTVDLPNAPAVRDTAVCAGNAVTLTPTAGGATYRFYADSTSTNPLAGGNNVSSFTTPILTTTTTFYVSAVSASGCEGTARRAVTVRVNALPSVSISRNGDTLVATAAAGNYQWFKDGNAIVGATTSNHRVVESGVYTVTLTSLEGCATTSNAITVDVTSVEDVGNSQALRWNSYPVPFTSELILQAEASFSYQLLDIRGAVLLQGQSEGVQATLNTSELASGIYLVRIAVNGQSAMRKLVKE